MAPLTSYGRLLSALGRDVDERERLPGRVAFLRRTGCPILAEPLLDAPLLPLVSVLARHGYLPKLGNTTCPEVPRCPAEARISGPGRHHQSLRGSQLTPRGHISPCLVHQTGGESRRHGCS